MEKEVIVQVNHLTKIYNKKIVLNDVNLTIHKGDIYGFVGKNGAGKTTLIRMLTDVAFPTSGDYSLFGLQGKELKEAHSRIAAMVETPAIYMDMTARDNLKTRCILLGLQDPDLLVNRLKEVGLSDVLDSPKKVNDFSLGMRQRLGIAMSILGDPELLILDEPTNGLDPEGIREIRELLVKLNREKETTILISSHILSELGKFATTYGFIDHGKIVKEISAKDLDRESQKSLLLYVNNPQEVASLVEKKFSYATEIDGDDQLIVYGVDNPSPLMKYLYTTGVDIKNFKEQENGLEDFFLSLVENENNV